MAPQWDEGSVGERQHWRCVDGSDDPEDSFSFQHCRSERRKRRTQSEMKGKAEQRNLDGTTRAKSASATREMKEKGTKASPRLP